MEKWIIVQPLVEQLVPLRDLGLLSVLGLIIVDSERPQVRIIRQRGRERLSANDLHNPYNSLYMSLGQNMTMYIS